MSSIVYDGNSGRNTHYNKYPNLVPSKNVNYSPISKKGKKNQLYNNLETNNEEEQSTNRKLTTKNYLSNEEFKGDNYNGINKNKIQKVNQNITNNIEENGETESEIQKKKQEKLNNEYDKYEINSSKSEGNDTNIVSSMLPSKCTIILRIIIYNFIRPIYLYLLIISIILSISSYSDLPMMISILIYLIMICTSIVIEIMEEKKGQNRLIFFNEKTKYKKITDNNILDIPGKNIQNGDIIVVKNGDVCPCDMIIIDSSANEIPLYFQSDTLSGSFNYNVRLIKNNILNKFSKIKNDLNPKFSEYIKSLQQEEIEKMLEEQKKVKPSQLVYRDFLERNDLINEQEEEQKKEEEKQKRLNELRFDPNNKIYEELKYQEYYKSISKNILKGYYYIPKDRKNLIYYLTLQFNEEKNDVNDLNNILEINQKNMCYCGEKVKNAMWIIGIVIYTGQEVSQLKDISEEFNCFSTYYKRRKSVLESEINYYFYILLTILLFLSIIAGVVNMVYIDYLGGILYNDIDKNRHPKSPAKNFYHSFLDYFCLMHSIIPYSIFFTLEIVLLFQKLFINSDIDLFNKNKDIITDSKQIQDLGKIDLILTDKTGTLTKNERYYKYCVIGDGCYEYRNDGKQSSLNSLAKNYNKVLTFADYDMINSSSYRKGNGIIDSVQYDGFVVRSVQDYNKCIYLDRTEKIIEEYWKAIALCHDAIPVFNKNNLYGEYYLEEQNKNEQKYFSNSGDNTTLVEMASKQGFTFFMDEKNTSIYMGDGTPTKENNQFYNLKNCNCEIILGEPGPETKKIILSIKKKCHLKFNSERKRESVIVQEGNYIKLYVKGPISEILDRIIDDYTPKKLIDNAKIWLSTVEGTGCRAFAVGMRILTSEEYNTFLDCFKEAQDDENDKKIRVNKVIDSIESNLTLLGGAFIEDLLPRKIEEAVDNIRNAGIKIWTVTGDKVSSSYSVGIATGIIDKSNLIIIAQINQEALLENENKIQNIEKDLEKRLNKRLNNSENQKNDKESEENNEKERLTKEKNKKIEERIKNTLKTFHKEFREMESKEPLINKANKFDIVIDSLSFREILKSQQHIKSFFDKALLANSLTFCEFNSNDKRLLVKNFRDYIKGIKNINSYTIMGVGDGFNDIEMLKEVDIGVGINNGINKHTKINIDNFVDLSRLIMFHGINNLKRNTGIIELLIVRHFIFGFIFFIYGCHCYFSNVHLIPTQDIYLCFFILNLFGPFLKGIFDINVFYFYDKKEKIEKDNDFEIKSNNSKESNENKDKDDNNEYKEEINKKKEKIENRMYKNIFDSSFKYIFYQKNVSLVESGSDHMPYKKYISICKFIMLIIKSIFFCIINFYITYGAVDSGHNIIDLSGNMIDFRRLQIILWSNNAFIIFLENEIFTYFYTIFRIIEIVLFLIIYFIIFFMYQKNNTKQSNPFSSFLLFLNFLLVILFCSFINFWIYIVDNLFDSTVIYKLRNMKISEKFLEEMKVLVNYKQEEEIDDEELEEQRKRQEKEKDNVLEIINKSDDDEKEIKDFGKNKYKNLDIFNFGNKEISSIYNSDTNYNNNLNENQNQKVIINRSNKKNKNNNYITNINELKNKQKMLDNFNKYLIGRKEIKNLQVQDSINLMNENKQKEKDKEIENKNELKYVVAKK